MTCHACEATERQFNEAVARRDVERFRRGGPDRTTRILLDAVRQVDLKNASLLDVGGGIGVVPCELMPEGIADATLVEAAWAYIGLARAEAERRGLGSRLRYVHGDFVRLAHGLPPADLVTLDRVICCYPDFEVLVAASAGKCRRWYAASLPRDRWYVRAAVALQNAARRLRGNPFRTYVHPTARVTELLVSAGFRPRFDRATPIWRILVYERPQAA